MRLAILSVLEAPRGTGHARAIFGGRKTHREVAEGEAPGSAAIALQPSLLSLRQYPTKLELSTYLVPHSGQFRTHKMCERA